MLDSILKILTSLRLTVICLIFGIILVFVGTVAQADEGLYQAQARYFKHWLVMGVSLFGYNVPLPLPGGYLIGSVLTVNLVAAHIKRFQFTWKKLGIHLTHVGLILLLVGQLTTDLFSRETQMHFAEGESRNYTQSGMTYELAIMFELNQDSNEVVSIPQSYLAHHNIISHEKLPFKLQVLHYWPNSDLSYRAPMSQNAPPATTNGVAQFFNFAEAPLTHAMDRKNIPSAMIDVKTAQGSLGSWMVSGWVGDEQLNAAIWRSYAPQAGEQGANRILQQLTTPQTVTIEGRSYEFVMRPSRVYKPFTITLLKTTHEVYPGTDIPKNFQSRVRITNDHTRENREVDIYMNNPLRYGGLTFYQYQMGREELDTNVGNSTLQVVRNPSWLAPYAGCGLVGVGLTAQFMIHLLGFLKRKK